MGRRHRSPGGTLPLVQDTRKCYSTGERVNHNFFFRVWLRESSRLDPNFFDFFESLLLFRLTRESDIHPCDSVQRSDKFGMPKYEYAILIGESQKNTLHLRLVERNFSVSQFRNCFGIRLHALRLCLAAQVLVFDFIESHLANLILNPASRKHSKTSRKRTMWSYTFSVAITMLSMYAITMLPSRFFLFTQRPSYRPLEEGRRRNTSQTVLRLYAKSSNSQAKEVFWRSTFLTGICQKAQARSGLM